MSQLSRTVKAHRKYQAERRKIKARQRVELEKENRSDLVEFGKAVYAAKSEGYTVEDIMANMGTKNKNLVYAALAAYHADTPLDETIEEAVPNPDSDKVSIVEVAQLSDTSVQVKIKLVDSPPEIYLLTVTPTGVVVNVPDEWLVNSEPEYRAAVRDAVKQIEQIYS